MTGVKMVFTSL